MRDTTNPMGWDKSRLEGQEDEVKPLLALSDILDDLYSGLFAKGFEVIPAVGGRFCGHDVYQSVAYPVKGITAPEGFRFKQLVSPSDTLQLLAFRKALRSVIEAGRSQSENKQEAGLWLQLYKDFMDNLLDPRCQTAKAALGVAKSGYRTTTLDGNNGAHKVIPPVSWFPESVKDLDPRDLLTLLPDVEAEALMLHLGRIAVGASGPKLEGEVLHTYRSYCLLVGTQAGLGKSTLLNYILDALEAAGYSTSQINSDLNKFGWGTVAVSDVATIDDLTEELQKRMLADPRIKSVVSNGRMKVEEKGLAAVDVSACTAVLGCTNLVNYAHYIGMDAGCLSRVNQLDTYTSEELTERWGKARDYRTRPFWEKEARDRKVSVTVLALWLLRCCMDRFLSVCGYQLANGSLTRTSESTLEAKVKELRAAYRIEVDLKHVKELVNVAARLVAIAVAKAEDPVKARLWVNNLDFDYYLLLTVMRWFTDSPNGNPKYPELTLTSLSRSCRDPIRAKVRELKTLTNSKSAAGAFEVLTKELLSTKGFGYPTRSAHYAAEWSIQVREIDALIRQHQDDDIEGQVYLEGAVETLQRRIAKLK